ncbi:MAG: hypothetical protein E7675_08225 [Ruminococcaceae bacterium]|nr:hypothetical protein [Oscillospiraceae bacterium]
MKFNNKKIISIIILSATLLSLLFVGSFAKDPEAKLDSYLRFTYNGKEMHLIDSKYSDTIEFDFDYCDWDTVDIEFTGDQFESMLTYGTTEYYDKNDKLRAIEIYVNYRTKTMHLEYISGDYYKDYEELIDEKYSDVDIYACSQYTFSEKTISSEIDVLTKGEEANLHPAKIYDTVPMFVYAKSSSGELQRECGFVLYNETNKSFYFIDYRSNPFSSFDDIDITKISTIKAYILEDAELVAEIEEVYNRDEVFFDDLEVFNEGAIAIVSLIISAIILGGGSLAVAIVFMIKARKAKELYRKLYTALAIICAICFVLVLVLLIMALVL